MIERGKGELGDAPTPDAFFVFMAAEFVCESRFAPLEEELGFTRLLATIDHRYFQCSGRIPSFLVLSTCSSKHA